MTPHRDEMDHRATLDYERQSPAGPPDVFDKNPPLEQVVNIFAYVMVFGGSLATFVGLLGFFLPEDVDPGKSMVRRIVEFVITLLLLVGSLAWIRWRLGRPIRRR